MLCLILDCSFYFTVYLRREKEDRDLCVILLTDTILLQLPLEGMSILQAKNIRSVARDFSLQVLCHRIGKFTVDESGKEKTKHN